MPLQRSLHRVLNGPAFADWRDEASDCLSRVDDATQERLASMPNFPGKLDTIDAARELGCLVILGPYDDRASSMIELLLESGERSSDDLLYAQAYVQN